MEHTIQVSPEHHTARGSSVPTHTNTEDSQGNTRPKGPLENPHAETPLGKHTSLEPCGGTHPRTPRRVRITSRQEKYFAIGASALTQHKTDRRAGGVGPDAPHLRQYGAPQDVNI